MSSFRRTVEKVAERAVERIMGPRHYRYRLNVEHRVSASMVVDMPIMRIAKNEYEAVESVLEMLEGLPRRYRDPSIRVTKDQTVSWWILLPILGLFAISLCASLWFEYKGDSDSASLMLSLQLALVVAVGIESAKRTLTYHSSSIRYLGTDHRRYARRKSNRHHRRLVT